MSAENNEDDDTKKGRPPVEIDAAKLEALAKLQCTHEEIAAVFECSKRTIIRKLKKDPELKAAYERGKQLGKVSLRRLQFRHANMANSAGVTMTIHLSKHHLGETDKAALELTGRVDSNVQVTTARERVSKKLDQLAQRIASRATGLALTGGTAAVSREPV